MPPSTLTALVPLAWNHAMPHDATVNGDRSYAFAYCRDRSGIFMVENEGILRTWLSSSRIWLLASNSGAFTSAPASHGHARAPGRCCTLPPADPGPSRGGGGRECVRWTIRFEKAVLEIEALPSMQMNIGPTYADEGGPNDDLTWPSFRNRQSAYVEGGWPRDHQRVHVLISSHNPFPFQCTLLRQITSIDDEFTSGHEGGFVTGKK